MKDVCATSLTRCRQGGNNHQMLTIPAPIFNRSHILAGHGFSCGSVLLHQVKIELMRSEVGLRSSKGEWRAWALEGKTRNEECQQHKFPLKAGSSVCWGVRV